MEKVINILLIGTLLGALIFGALAYHFRNAEHDSVTEGEYSFPVCDYIDIDLLKLPVTVVPYDGDEIVVAYKNDLPLSIETGDNSLMITESDMFVISLFAGGEAEFALNLYLPRRTYREIYIYTGNGTVRIGGVDCQKFSALTEGGDIICKGMNSLLNITTTSGFISVDFNTVVSDSEILSRNGNVELILPKDSSVAVDFETETGHCETNLWGGLIPGSYMFSFNGGDKLVHAVLDKGVLTIKEKEQ